ncbi:MAG: DUF4870 domain-containing protein [Micromonosporaceae bacterium]|nr:DUF4870 domain-containing protein [Micromonosporaceae bacterium]
MFAEVDGFATRVCYWRALNLGPTVCGRRHRVVRIFRGGTPMGAPYPGPPTGYANSDEKTWALIAHFGGIVVGFIAGLIALLAKGNESPTVRAHAVEALNFQITWSAATLIASILAVCSFGILFFLPLVTWLVMVIFGILAGVRAIEGQLYRYPLSLRLIK